MAQVIQVNLLNPADGKQVHSCFTRANTYKESVTLAIRDFSQGTITLLETHALTPGEFMKEAAPPCWYSRYACAVVDHMGEYDLVADLFASHQEREATT